MQINNTAYEMMTFEMAKNITKGLSNQARIESMNDPLGKEATALFKLHAEQDKLSPQQVKDLYDYRKGTIVRKQEFDVRPASKMDAVFETVGVVTISSFTGLLCGLLANKVIEAIE